MKEPRPGENEQGGYSPEERKRAIETLNLREDSSDSEIDESYYYFNLAQKGPEKKWRLKEWADNNSNGVSPSIDEWKKYETQIKAIAAAKVGLPGNDSWDKIRAAEKTTWVKDNREGDNNRMKRQSMYENYAWVGESIRAAEAKNRAILESQAAAIREIAKQKPTPPPPEPNPIPKADKGYELENTTEVMQGLRVAEISMPPKSKNRGSVYAKSYVPVDDKTVLRVEHLVPDLEDFEETAQPVKSAPIAAPEPNPKTPTPDAPKGVRRKRGKISDDAFFVPSEPVDERTAIDLNPQAYAIAGTNLTERSQALPPDAAKQKMIEKLNGIVDRLVTHQRPDLDAKFSVYLITELAKVKTDADPELRNIAVRAVSMVEKGDWLKGAMHVDTSYRPAGVTVEEDETSALEHHSKERTEHPTSTAAETYKFLVDNGFMQREQWIDDMTSFITEVDNLSYTINRDEYKNFWWSSLFAVYNVVPFEDLIEVFQRDKVKSYPDSETYAKATKIAPFEVTTRENLLNPNLPKRQITTLYDYILLKKEGAEKTSENIPKLEQEMRDGIRIESAFNQGRGERITEGMRIKTEHPELGKVLVAVFRSEYLGRIQGKDRFFTDRTITDNIAPYAFGYDTYISYNQGTNTFFIQSKRDINKIYDSIKDLDPQTLEITPVRGQMVICRVREDSEYARSFNRNFFRLMTALGLNADQKTEAPKDEPETEEEKTERTRQYINKRLGYRDNPTLEEAMKRRADEVGLNPAEVQGVESSAFWFRVNKAVADRLHITPEQLPEFGLDFIRKYQFDLLARAINTGTCFVPIDKGTALSDWLRQALERMSYDVPPGREDVGRNQTKIVVIEGIKKKV